MRIKEIHELAFEVESIGMSLDLANSLSDEMDHAANYYEKALTEGHDVDVKELVRKLNFYNNMLHLQIRDLNDNVKKAMNLARELRKNNRV